MRNSPNFTGFDNSMFEPETKKSTRELFTEWAESNFPRNGGYIPAPASPAAEQFAAWTNDILNPNQEPEPEPEPEPKSVLRMSAIENMQKALSDYERARKAYLDAAEESEAKSSPQEADKSHPAGTGYGPRSYPRP